MAHVDPRHRNPLHFPHWFTGISWVSSGLESLNCSPRGNWKHLLCAQALYRSTEHIVLIHGLQIETPHSSGMRECLELSRTQGRLQAVSGSSMGKLENTRRRRSFFDFVFSFPRHGSHLPAVWLESSHFVSIMWLLPVSPLHRGRGWTLLTCVTCLEHTWGERGKCQLLLHLYPSSRWHCSGSGLNIHAKGQRQLWDVWGTGVGEVG